MGGVYVDMPTDIFRATCPEPGCNDGTGKPYGAESSYVRAEDAAADLAGHWGVAHAPQHVKRATVTPDFQP